MTMSRKLLYILSGIAALIVIVIAIIIFVILPSTITAKSAQTTATPTAVATPTKIAKSNPLQQAIQQNAVDSIATALGFSSDQLQTLIHDAF